MNCFVTEGGWGGLEEVEKSHFGLAIGSRSSDLDQNWHGHGLSLLKQAYGRIFILLKSQDGDLWSIRSKIDQI